MTVAHDAEYDALLKELGQRIKQMRKARGWSQRDMVVKHGYNDSQWRKYERGGGITLHSLVRLSKTFEVLTGHSASEDKGTPAGAKAAKKRPAPLKRSSGQ